MAQRVVSVDEIATAMEHGGYPIGRKYFFRSHLPLDVHVNSDEALTMLPPGELVDVCALGIAALNLGVGAYSLYQALYAQDAPKVLLLFSMNDKAPVKSLKQIARYLSKSFMGKFIVEEFDYGAVFNNYKGKTV